MFSEQIDRMAADVKFPKVLQRYYGGSMALRPQLSGHSKHSGVSISQYAAGHDCLNGDTLTVLCIHTMQPLQPEIREPSVVLHWKHCSLCNT